MKTATRSTTVSPRLISRSSRNASLFWQELAPHCSRCRGADGKRIRSCASSRRRRKTGRIGAGTAARGRARGNASASRESHNKRWTGRIVGGSGGTACHSCRTPRRDLGDSGPNTVGSEPRLAKAASARSQLANPTTDPGKSTAHPRRNPTTPAEAQRAGHPPWRSHPQT